MKVTIIAFLDPAEMASTGFAFFSGPLLALTLAGCTATSTPPSATSKPVLQVAEEPHGDVDALITYYAGVHHVPETLVRATVARESNFNPSARNGRYMGLMQIDPRTARTMGYRGTNEGLLDPKVNLEFAVKYLAGAYLVADGDPALATRYYRRGYYYAAKKRGLLVETGLRPAR